MNDARSSALLPLTPPARTARSTTVHPLPNALTATTRKTQTTTVLGSPRAAAETHSTSAHALQREHAVAALRQRIRADVWCEALSTVFQIVKSACVSVGCAWTANWVLSLGNVFAGKPPVEQSNGEFLAAAALVNYCMFYLVTIATHAAVLQSFQYASRAPTYRPPFWLCFGRLMWQTSVVFALSLALFVCTGVGVYAAPLRVRKHRIGFYALCPWVHMYTTAATAAVRRIFCRDTVAGQRQQRATRRPSSRWRAFRRFWKVYALTLPKVLVVASAGLYVQLVRQVQIASTADFLLYSASNLALKAVIKEISKLGIVRFRVKDVRTIFVVAGLPTVLISTQVRVMLQRVTSVKYTLAWTLGTAVLEIGTRAAKVFLTNRAVRRKKREMRIATLGLIPASALALAPARTATRDNRARSVSNFEKFELWRRQILAFQVAEVYANMSAEYIAIGCSASIVFFFWDHSKYALNPSRSGPTTAAPSSSPPLMSSTPASVSASPSLLPSSALQLQASGIAIQVAVEIGVDVVSSALEISRGVEFGTHVRKYRSFIALFFVSIAVLNILISSIIYYDPR